jgi:hypothetical protein
VFDDRIAPLAAAVLRGQSFCEMWASIKIF